MYSTQTYHNLSVGYQSWQALWIFSLYRMGLVCVLLLFYFSKPEMYWGGAHPGLFGIVVFSYMGVAALFLTLVHCRVPTFDWQVMIQVCVDIAVLTLFIHVCRQFSTDFSFLINVTIAGGSVLMAGRISLFFAALATLAVFGQKIFLSLDSVFVGQEFVSAAVVGITFFATSILGYSLARRLRESEYIADQRANHLKELAVLNDFVIQRLHSGILVIDNEHKVQLLNVFAERLLGQQLMHAQQHLVDYAPALYERFVQWLRQPGKSLHRFRSQAQASDLIAQFSCLGDTGDAPTLIFLDDAMRTAQQVQEIKIASLGRLTASIAHEIRNPMAAITHAAQLLEESHVVGQSERHFIEIICRNATRMDHIVESVLSFSRRESANTTDVDLSSWLLTFVQNFKQSQLAPIEVTLSLTGQALHVCVDTLHLQQILANLCENGLRYSQQHSGQAHVKLSLYQQDNNEVCLDIIDSGPGVEVALGERIFEPFFTTEHSGTGLGLYLAKELAEANYMGLTYINLPQGGCCFRLIFR